MKWRQKNKQRSNEKITDTEISRDRKGKNKERKEEIKKDPARKLLKERNRKKK
jgi:hypothetical protein